MSSIKPVSINGQTYNVSASVADSYAKQLVANQQGKGPAPDVDAVINASASPNASTGSSSQGSLDAGANVGVAPPAQSGQFLNLNAQISVTSSSSNSGTAPAMAASSASGAAIGGAANSNGTPFDGSTGPIGAASASANDPTVTVQNNSSTPRYYKIEASAGKDPQSLNNNTFVLQPGQSATINPGQGFIGAITDQGSSTNAANTGTRQEVNFGTAGKTWYDADLERGGATKSTLGPTDTGLKADDGSNSLVGDHYAYLTPGSVAGQTTNAAGAADDKKNRVISTQKMSILST